ncbi:hypothetical protein TrST_g10972 [Triparma strigata]|uniref:Uncharacterized protein n=2 Tax=Triparma strigata TaxID=1606541 RepID=A0A9W7F0A6_9STRA|nr:hypothetical protein TrST_g10972 [Triparma strigata]
MVYLGVDMKSIPSFPPNCILLQLSDSRIYGSRDEYNSGAFGERENEISEVGETTGHHKYERKTMKDVEGDAKNQTQLEPRDVQKELRAQYLTLKKEVHHAKQHLKIEERKLKEEEKDGEDLQQEIKEASEAVELVRTQTEKVSQLLSHRQNQLKSTTFLLQTRQITLLNSLRSFFPIEKVSAQTWTINGLNLTKPYDESEEAGSAWGLVVHLLTMLSKYLDIPLRYKLLSNSSRSAIQDGSRIYPLFGRGFNDGVRCLTVCVEGLLRARDIVSKEEHVLGKIGELLVGTCDPRRKEREKSREVRRKKTEQVEAMFR